jgi:hypothetical protein
MASLIKRIKTSSGDCQIDYNALANLPKYAASSSAGGAASSVANSLTLTFNGGSTEGTNLFTFNGSSAKSINLTPTTMYGISDGGIAGVKEKSTSGERYAKIIDIQCSSHYHRICQSVLLTSRTDAIILTIMLGSGESNKFDEYKVCYTPLTNTYGNIVGNLHAGLVNVSNDINKFELWYHQNQWGHSLNITPIARNEEGKTVNFYSYSAADACSTSKPTFATNLEVQNACTQ